MSRPASVPRAIAAIGVILGALAGPPLRAQGARGAGRPLPVAPPSRAESLLAVGRLRAAEDALYAAVDAAPREPSARGELGRYLASRARFVIADILFGEALRFGADTARVAEALLAIAPYRPEVDRRRIPGARLSPAEAGRERARVEARGGRADAAIAGAPVTVPMIFLTDGRGIGSFEVRGPGGARRAVLDPAVQGVRLARADDAALAPRSFGATGRGAPLLLPQLEIGARTLEAVEARVDPDLPPDEVRLGFDVLWALAPVFDERAGTMTLPAERARRVPGGATQVPMALGFPGIWLVPAVGRPPVPIASVEGRALLGGARWWWDASSATIVVQR